MPGWFWLALMVSLLLWLALFLYGGWGLLTVGGVLTAAFIAGLLGWPRTRKDDHR